MERTEVLDMMGALKLYGMKGAYGETLAAAIKRKHEPQRFVGDLLKAEISEKQARSIRYQMTIAKLPLARDVDDFAFKGTPINESLVRDLAGGNFVAQQRNAVLVGGTGTGKTHLAIALERSCIRAGSRGRFFTTVDLVNRLEAEGRARRLDLHRWVHRTPPRAAASASWGHSATRGAYQHKPAPTGSRLEADSGSTFDAD